MLRRIIKIFTSLRLTVTLLAFGILLVWVGTVAQADEGLYQAQTRYFRHWLVWGITMFGHKIPVGLPGGYLLGTLLLINLTAAHIQRFQWTWKKFGIHLTHAGVILLLVGQLTTDLLSRETQMRVVEGETKSYSESPMDYELAFVTDVDANTDQVVAIPQSRLAPGGEIQDEKLPFTVRVKTCWPNSEPSFRAPMQSNGPPLTEHGIARHFDFREMPVTHKMDDKNVPTAVLELAGASGPLGTWVASGWSGDETMAAAVRATYQRQLGPPMADTIAARLGEPQFVEAGSKRYNFTLRPTRAYKPFSLTLLKATHSFYSGSEIPKDYRSRVRIDNPEKLEKREVEIYMNSPLRYGGLTFYQYQMPPEAALRAGETPWSTLQVVRNPAWLTPYAGCAIVAAGLVFQFMIHLVGFISRRKPA
jgi:hypothetical protein